MKLSLKSMLLATLCCVILTVADLLVGCRWTSPREFKTILYWIIVLIGWAVYFLERRKKKIE